MIPKNKASIVKGMLFAGCSFTWGQGLYYYSNLDTLQEPPPDKYIANYIRPSHIKFMESVRFPRIVANHFKTWELVTRDNGGSNLGASEWWNKHLRNQTHSHQGQVQHEVLTFTEIDKLIFQFTQPHRDMFTFTIKVAEKDMEITYPLGHILFDESTMYHDINIKNLTGKTLKELFFEYLEKSNISFDQIFKEFVRQNIMNIKNWLVNWENNGVETFVVAWPNECIEHIEADPFLSERFIPLRYKEKIYKSMEGLMSKENPEMMIKTDFENFQLPPQDHHPSLACHQVMAINIINFIESKNVKV